MKLTAAYGGIKTLIESLAVAQDRAEINRILSRKEYIA
jgi:hypothetical protein